MATSGRLTIPISEGNLSGCAVFIDWTQEQYEGTSYPYSKIYYEIKLNTNKAITASTAKYIGVELLFNHSYKLSANVAVTTREYAIRTHIEQNYDGDETDILYFDKDITVSKAGTYTLTTGYAYQSSLTSPPSSSTSSLYYLRHQADGTLYNAVLLPEGETAEVRINTGSTTRYDIPVEGELGIDCIILPTRVSTVSTAYIGDEITLVIDRQIDTYTHSISYEMNGIGGTIIEKSNLESVLWSIPTSLIAGIPEGSTHGTLTLTCYTYSSSGALLATTTTTLIARMDVNASAPTFNPVIKDINPTTLALTGNENAVVQYYSNLSIQVGAVAKDGATIKSQGGNCGGKKFTGATATLNAVESADVYLTATDSRGFTAETTVSKVLIPYRKLTCNLIPYPTSTTGVVTFILEGNCFGSSFGKVTNSFTIEYRYKIEDGEYGNWTAVETSITGSTYSIRVDVEGFDYKTLYTFQARITDLLSSATSNESAIIGKPIFDWGRTDFNFNVRITAQEDLTLANEQTISAIDSYGNETVALIPCDSTNSLSLGIGGYQEEQGATYIYGNDVNIISNNDISLNGVSINQLINALSKSYDFTTSVSTGGNYSSASCALTLRGNSLYCRFYGVRGAISNTGDISDEIMAHIEFNHGGKITGMDYVGGVSTTSGGTAGLSMSNVIVNEQTASFDMYLCNVASASRNFLTAFSIPVSINVAAFNE